MFAAYTIPPVTGISFALGNSAPQPLQAGDARLCLLAYAIAAQQALGLGGMIVNAATTPSLGFSFPGLDPASPYQPYYLILPTGSDFLGYRVAQMYGPNPINGGGIGAPGAFVNLTWTPTPIPPSAVLPPASNSGDAQAFLNVLTGGTPAPAAGGGAFPAAQAAQLTHVENMMVAMLTANRIPVPTA